MVEERASDWFVERGIGEDRALLTIAGQIIAAKLHWPGELFAGQQVEAKLAAKPGGARRGTAMTNAGREILVDHLPSHLTEGEMVTLTVTRAAVGEKGRFKRAQGRYLQTEHPADLKWLPEAREVREFAGGCWEDIWEAASSGEISFDGGSLHFSVTPAMTLIDVDGSGTARQLALAAVPVIASWLRAFDLGGNIGIDFPTISNKADRKAIDAALDEVLSDWPHERTAMNGYGFVQIVARMEGPSLLHRFATSRVGMCARMALRRAELAAGAGAVLLVTVHPALKTKLKSEWLEELARRTGKQVRIESNPALALEAAQAQIIEP